MNSLKRIVFFFRKNGLATTGFRLWTAINRFRYLGRMFLYSCRLPVPGPFTDEGVAVERVVEGAIPEEDRSRLLDSPFPADRARQIEARFAAGSILWLARVDGILAGYGWTLQGNTVEPYFFPLQKEDIHFYDFFVYPEFRGRGINVVLVNQILYALDKLSMRRALIECAAWNDSQIRSLGKTRFRLHAIASKWILGGRTLVLWHRG